MDHETLPRPDNETEKPAAEDLKAFIAQLNATPPAPREGSTAAERTDWRAMRSEVTATHEAAHAVLAVRFDIATTVELNIDQQIADGRVGTTSETSSKDLDDMGWPRAMVLLAGYCAEVHAGYDERDARSGAERDFHLLGYFDLIAGHTEGEAIEAAMTLVSEPTNWRAIKAVAAELMENGRLDDAAIRRIIGESDAVASDRGY